MTSITVDTTALVGMFYGYDVKSQSSGVNGSIITFNFTGYQNYGPWGHGYEENTPTYISGVFNTATGDFEITVERGN